ncbi:MAG: hypothetical protein ACI82Z_000885 [Cellvibrionaceae bacterium]
MINCNDEKGIIKRELRRSSSFSLKKFLPAKIAFSDTQALLENINSLRNATRIYDQFLIYSRRRIESQAYFSTGVDGFFSHKVFVSLQLPFRYFFLFNLSSSKRHSSIVATARSCPGQEICQRFFESKSTSSLIFNYTSSKAESVNVSPQGNADNLMAPQMDPLNTVLHKNLSLLNFNFET